MNQLDKSQVPDVYFGLGAWVNECCLGEDGQLLALLVLLSLLLRLMVLLGTHHLHTQLGYNRLLLLLATVVVTLVVSVLITTTTAAILSFIT